MDETKVIRGFGVLNRLFMSYLSKEIMSKDISYSDSIFLVNIGAGEGSTQEEISNLLAIDKAAIARSVKHLEKDGYVRVERPKTDKRAKELYLTEKGRDLFTEMQKINNRWVGYVLQDFKENDRKHISKEIEMIDNRAREFMNLEKTMRRK